MGQPGYAPPSRPRTFASARRLAAGRLGPLDEHAGRIAGRDVGHPPCRWPTISLGAAMWASGRTCGGPKRTGSSPPFSSTWPVRSRAPRKGPWLSRNRHLPPAASQSARHAGRFRCILYCTRYNCGKTLLLSREDWSSGVRNIGEVNVLTQAPVRLAQPCSVFCVPHQHS